MKVGFVQDGHRGLCAYAEVSIAGRSGRSVRQTALIDTGFNGYISLPTTVVEDLGLLPIGAHVVELANAEVANVLLFSGEVTIGNIVEVVIGNIVRAVPIHGIGNEPTIGTSLFRYHHLSIDFMAGGDVDFDKIE